MLENVEEKVNALTKLADLIGKQTLVMWCIVTTVTTGYLYFKYDLSQEKRITENSAGYERLVKEMREVREEQKVIKTDAKETKEQVNNTIPKLDTLINKTTETIENIK